jgi:hypothetical protein
VLLQWVLVKLSAVQKTVKLLWVAYLSSIPDFQGRKLAKSITNSLIQHFGDGNLMASTEIKKPNNGKNS